MTELSEAPVSNGNNTTPKPPGRIQLREVNAHLTCRLCNGYYIDATTIVECLHSFCRSCIVKHLQVHHFCPICEMMINTAKPNIKPDKTLQDIVYKLVPGLHRDEMRRRREFYAARPDAAADRSGEQRGEDTERVVFDSSDAFSLALEFSSGDIASTLIMPPRCDVLKEDGSKEKRGTKDNPALRGGEDGSPPPRRYLQCPAGLAVRHLKKFVVGKYDIDTDKYYVDILYKRIPLPDHYTLMDIAYIYSWKRNAPMNFYFRVVDIKHAADQFDFIEPIFIKKIPYKTSTKDKIKRRESLKKDKKEAVNSETCKNSVDKLSVTKHCTDSEVKINIVKCDDKVIQNGVQNNQRDKTENRDKNKNDSDKSVNNKKVSEKINRDSNKSVVKDVKSENKNSNVDSNTKVQNSPEISDVIEVEKSLFLNTFELTSTKNVSPKKPEDQPSPSFSQVNFNQNFMERLKSPKTSPIKNNIEEQAKQTSPKNKKQSPKSKPTELEKPPVLKRKYTFKVRPAKRKKSDEVPQLTTKPTVKTSTKNINLNSTFNSSDNKTENNSNDKLNISTQNNSVHNCKVKVSHSYITDLKRKIEFNTDTNNGTKKLHIESERNKNTQQIKTTHQENQTTNKKQKIQDIPQKLNGFVKKQPEQITDKPPQVQMNLQNGSQLNKSVSKSPIPTTNFKNPPQNKHSQSTNKPSNNSNPLKTLFNTCNLNIPSSLSITLTESDQNNGTSNGSSKRQSPPVNMSIEIFKIPDKNENSNVPINNGVSPVSSYNQRTHPGLPKVVEGPQPTAPKLIPNPKVLANNIKPVSHLKEIGTTKPPKPKNIKLFDVRNQINSVSNGIMVNNSQNQNVKVTLPNSNYVVTTTGIQSLGQSKTNQAPVDTNQSIGVNVNTDSPVNKNDSTIVNQIVNKDIAVDLDQTKIENDKQKEQVKVGNTLPKNYANNTTQIKNNDKNQKVNSKVSLLTKSLFKPILPKPAESKTCTGFQKMFEEAIKRKEEAKVLQAKVQDAKSDKTKSQEKPKVCKPKVTPLPNLASSPKPTTTKESVVEDETKTIITKKDEELPITNINVTPNKNDLNIFNDKSNGSLDNVESIQKETESTPPKPKPSSLNNNNIVLDLSSSVTKNVSPSSKGESSSKENSHHPVKTSLNVSPKTSPKVSLPITPKTTPNTALSPSGIARTPVPTSQLIPSNNNTINMLKSAPKRSPSLPIKSTPTSNIPKLPMKPTSSSKKSPSHQSDFISSTEPSRNSPQQQLKVNVTESSTPSFDQMSPNTIQERFNLTNLAQFNATMGQLQHVLMLRQQIELQNRMNATGPPVQSPWLMNANSLMHFENYMKNLQQAHQNAINSAKK